MFRGGEGTSTGLRTGTQPGQLAQSLDQATPALSAAQNMSITAELRGSNPYESSSVTLSLAKVVSTGRGRPSEATLGTTASALKAQGGIWDYEQDEPGQAQLLRSGPVFAALEGSAPARATVLRALRRCVRGLRPVGAVRPPALDVVRATGCLAGRLPGLQAELIGDHGLLEWYAGMHASAADPTQPWPDAPVAAWRSGTDEGHTYLLRMGSTRDARFVAADIAQRISARAFSMRNDYGLSDDAQGATVVGSDVVVGFGEAPDAGGQALLACGV